jgi:methylmalonyl-CoA/ethylmalonyl-CoA epimerase
VAFALNQIGQIALAVRDVERSEAFYGDKLGLRKLFRFGGLSFYDCAGLRLMLDQVPEGGAISHGFPVYFKVADIALARRELEARGVAFVDQIHMISPMDDHDLWMTFFKDPDEHLLALMCEAPKGYQPA